MTRKQHRDRQSMNNTISAEECQANRDNGYYRSPDTTDINVSRITSIYSWGGITAGKVDRR